MIGSWELNGLSRPHRFFAFAESYLQAAMATCSRMSEHKALQLWQHASVAMLLGSHSVELFLKGAILGGGVEFQRTHELRNLKNQYDQVHVDDQFRFDCPFVTNFEGLEEEAERILKENPPAAPSIYHRYPEDRDGSPWWHMIGACSPGGLLHTFDRLNEVYVRVMPLFGFKCLGQ